jgi:hypothetical protein
MDRFQDGNARLTAQPSTQLGEDRRPPLTCTCTLSRVNEPLLTLRWAASCTGCTDACSGQREPLIEGTHPRWRTRRSCRSARRLTPPVHRPAAASTAAAAAAARPWRHSSAGIAAVQAVCRRRRAVGCSCRGRCSVGPPGVPLPDAVGWQPRQAGCAAVFIDKNRRDIGKSQSKRAT